MHAHSHDTKNLNMLGTGAAVCVAALLVLLKLYAYQKTDSLTVATALIDSAIDLFMSSAGFLTVIYAAKPADHDHSFGHSSAEDLMGLTQAVMVTLSAIYIGTNAMSSLLGYQSAEIENTGIGLWVMGASILLTSALVIFMGIISRKTGSKVVAGDRLHYLSDLLPNIAAIFALLFSRYLGFDRLDAILALIAAAFLVSGGYQIGMRAINALMDRAADQDTITKIEKIASEFPGVVAFHDLKTRLSGSQLFIQLHVELNGQQTLKEAHDISAGLRRALLKAFPNADIIIHQDPI